MRRISILTIMIVMVIGRGVAENTNQIIFEFISASEENTAINNIIERMLENKDEDLLSVFVSPNILALSSGVVIRRDTGDEYQFIYKRRYFKILDIMGKRVNELNPPESYVREIRKILRFSENSLVLKYAIDLYANIINNNPPAQSGYKDLTPKELFCLDVTSALTRISQRQAAGEYEILYTTSHALAHVNTIIKDAPNLFSQGTFISNLLALVDFNRTKQVHDLLEDLLYIVFSDAKS